MITLYEQIKRAKKGDILFFQRPARNVTSAAHRLGRKVETAQYMVIPTTAGPKTEFVLRVKVLS